MKSLGIIWNTAYNFRYEVLKTLGKYAKTLSIKNIDFDNWDEYEEFVRAMYPQVTPKRVIDEKIYHMKFTNCNSICIVVFDIDTSAVRYHPRKKHEVYANLQDMKDEIRNVFANKVISYFFDTIFHCTDNEDEFNADLDTINTFMVKHKRSLVHC